MHNFHTFSTISHEFFVTLQCFSHEGMELMQFSSVMLLTLLMLKLLMLPRKVAVNPVVATARWLLATGIALLDVQFLVQLVLGLRAMGVTQAVLVNLVLFVPASWTISLSVLHLQRQGRTSLTERWVGGVAWIVILALLGTTAAIDGKPLLSDSKPLHSAEVAASIVYLAMQAYYSSLHLRSIIAMQRALQNYYDRDTNGMLRWMKLSILVLMVLAWLVPLLIFVESKGLAIFGILFFVGIFFLVDSFCGYIVSAAPNRISIAEESEHQEDDERRKADREQSTNNNAQELTTNTMQHVGEAVERWVAAGGYRQAGLTMPTAAEAIGVPRYLLSAWLRTEPDRTYTSWMTTLRIAEAKRVILAHPDWNNETVAQHCGFADRSYFQRIFKKYVGITPSDFAR